MKTYFAFALVFAINDGRAQSYPDKPIRMVAPFAVGGALDVVARIVGAKLTESWGSKSSSTTASARAATLARNTWPKLRPMATRC